VRIDGVDLVPTLLEPEEAFHRAFKFAEFDITEISMSSHTVMTARGESAYVGVPAFLSRVFRHSGIYINSHKGIARPEDLIVIVVGGFGPGPSLSSWPEGAPGRPMIRILRSSIPSRSPARVSNAPIAPQRRLC